MDIYIFYLTPLADFFNLFLSVFLISKSLFCFISATVGFIVCQCYLSFGALPPKLLILDFVCTVCFVKQTPLSLHSSHDVWTWKC